jgi:hypothetical protein
VRVGQVVGADQDRPGDGERGPAGGHQPHSGQPQAGQLGGQDLPAAAVLGEQVLDRPPGPLAAGVAAGQEGQRQRAGQRGHQPGRLGARGHRVQLGGGMGCGQGQLGAALLDPGPLQRLRLRARRPLR